MDSNGGMRAREHPRSRPEVGPRFEPCLTWESYRIVQVRIGTRGERENVCTAREANTTGKGSTKGSTGRSGHWHYPNANSRYSLVFAFPGVAGADSAPNAVGSGGSAHRQLRTNALSSPGVVAERIRGTLGFLEDHKLAGSYRHAPIPYRYAGVCKRGS